MKPSAGSILAPLFFLAAALAAAFVAVPSLTFLEPPPGTGPEEEAFAKEPTFHAPVPFPALPPGSAFCGECHDLPPHGGEGVAPAFYNDHTSFMECLVCHWARRSGDRPELGWLKNDTGGMNLGLEAPDGGKVDAQAIRPELVKKQVCFDKGISCTRCHGRGRMEPYAKPGLSPQGQAALENLPDFFTISKGTKWYFPQRQQ